MNIEEKIKDKESQIKNIQYSLNSLAFDKIVQKGTIAEAQKKLSSVEKEIVLKEKEIDRLEGEIENLKKYKEIKAGYVYCYGEYQKHKTCYLVVRNTTDMELSYIKINNNFNDFSVTRCEASGNIPFGVTTNEMECIGTYQEYLEKLIKERKNEKG
jgi:hypothetical protein